MRAQAEIIGLLVLVILFAFGFLFYLRLSQTPAPNVRTSFEGTQFGQAFVTTIIRSEVRDAQCGTVPVELGVLLRAISESAPGPCNSVNDAKRVVSQEFERILQGTLNKWGYSYQLLFLKDAELLRFDDPACTEDREKLPAGSQFIPTKTGNAELRLEICS